MSEDETALRIILAYRVAGTKLYTDDGELQDNTVAPFIDFKRDTPAEIMTKLATRTIEVSKRYLK